jgi:uncharacterized membrane protein YphA (DoxX/SURF4 family)
MDAALLIARLVLAGVFALAGVAKLSDLEGSRKAIIDFGLPAVLASPLALLLPLAELAVAAALIPASTAWWGALGALGLLMLFVVGISLNLARGRKPDCHCFGQLHSAPAGWKTLARNGVLAAVAGFVLWEGYGVAGPSAISWLGALSAAQLLALVGGVLVLSLLAGQWWFLAHLLRQNGRLLVRLEAVEESVAAGGGLAPSQNGTALHQAEGLPVGSEAPSSAFRASTERPSPSKPCALRANRCCCSLRTPAAAPATRCCRMWDAGNRSTPRSSPSRSSAGASRRRTRSRPKSTA